MAYDEGFAQRLRAEMADRAGLTEKKMFGGLAFLLHGNMCVGVTGSDLLARISPDRFDEVVARPGARPFAMGGRTMAGWLVVDSAQLADPKALSAWVQEAERFVKTLPKK